MRSVYCKTLIIAFGIAASGCCFADSITIGTGQGLNCDPFGCPPFTFFTGTRYQQAYAASDFAGSGPINISSISFFYSATTPGVLRTGTYSLSLSTISAGIDTLSNTNFDSNRGANNSLFTVVSLSGAPAATLSFSGAPFLYDPSQGNLLLDIVVSNASDNSLNSYFLAMNGTANGIFSRYQNFGAGTTGYGLVTRFDYSNASVPEPATLGLLIAPLFFFGVRLSCRRLRSARA